MPVNSESDPRLLSEEQKCEIRKLAVQYGIDLKGDGVPHTSDTKIKIDFGTPIEEVHLNFLEILCLYRTTITTPKKDVRYSSPSYSLAQYVLLLHQAYQEKAGIKVSSQGKYKRSCIIPWDADLYTLLLLTNSLLYRKYQDIYFVELDIPVKHLMDYEGIRCPALYSIAELERIIEYERQDEARTIFEAKQQLKRLLHSIRHYYIAEGVFQSKTKEPTSSEYRFLVYTLVVLGIYTAEDIDIIKRKGEDEKVLIRDYFKGK